jgi:hypothetical protein
MTVSKGFVLGTLTVLGGLCACSGIPKRESEAVTLERYKAFATAPISQISTIGRFNGWRPLGNEHLVVWDGFDKAYLLTVQGPCLNLAFANHISLRSRTGLNSIDSGFDFVRVGRGEQCRINEIRPVDYQKLREAERTAH